MARQKRVGIVTGASRGLGKVIARVLLNHGVDLVVGGRDQTSLAAAVGELASGDATVVPVPGDVADPSVRQRLIDAARGLGGLDLLVNNASALGPIRPLMEFDVRKFGQLLDVNAGAPLALMQLAAPLLGERRGLVVNITSDAAVAAYPGWGPYGSTKAALELLSRTFGGELAERGVFTTVVDPGDMRTAMHQEAFPGEDISDRPLPEVTVPFWNWLFEQRPDHVHGQRFSAQAKDTRWLQPA
jgi:NAD(P)-dependent dehydrogenase (short-subunit alcohol dehydrogenase family)